MARRSARRAIEPEAVVAGSATKTPARRTRVVRLIDRQPADTEPARATDDILASGFAAAVRKAVATAHAAGLAVPGRTADRAPVEHRPDGRIMPIDDTGAWSPETWKTRD